MGILDFLRRPDPDRFAKEFIAQLQAASNTEELIYDAKEFRIERRKDGKSVGEFNLGNMYQGYVAQPRGERASFIKNSVRGMLATQRELPEDFETARSDLRAKFWSRAQLESVRLRGILNGDAKNALDLPGELIGTHLLLCPVFDWPESLQSLNAKALADWGVTVYEALEAARQNLDESFTGYAKIGEGLYVLHTGDTYDAARLVLLDRIRAMTVSGQHVAMVPNRDTLIVTGSEDETSLGMMAALAEQALGEPYPLSAFPVILDQDGWRDWMPTRDHPHYRAFSNMALRSIGPEYAKQKELLDAVHEAQGIETFVASVSAIEKPDKQLVSYCVWGEGIETLLPMTHKVYIMGGDQKEPLAIGDWERVRELAGDLVEETEHYPPRYRVRGIPDPGALEAIGIAEL